MNLLTASKRALAIAALLLGCDSGGGQTGTPDAAAPTGACCGATCSDSTESACVGQFVPAPSCAAEPCPKGRHVRMLRREHDDGGPHQRAKQREPRSEQCG